MIVIKVFGGLGNQMFQYAFGRALAIEHKTNLFLDLSWFNEKSSSTTRTFQLDLFNAEFNIADKKLIKKHKPVFFKILNTALVKLNIGKLQNSRYFVEKNLSFNPSIKIISNNCYINGYWQSEKYFLKIKDVIQKEFNFNNIKLSDLNKTVLNQIISTNSISVHIRRSDYTLKSNNEIHGVLPISYYNKSMEIIAKSIKNPTYFIFSDDIDWVKIALKNNFGNVHYITGNPNYVDLFLKSQCKHNIIANSTFSWWSAWLNKNENKLVFAPNKWYNNQLLNRQTKDLIPESWIRI